MSWGATGKPYTGLAKDHVSWRGHESSSEDWCTPLAYRFGDEPAFLMNNCDSGRAK
jgi:hypothetical protein